MDEQSTNSDHFREESPPRKSSSSSGSAAYEMVPLEPGFEPTSLDVICARGKEAFNHSGNIRFRALVQEQLHSYSSSASKMEKSKIVRDIIESVRLASPQGGFVKKVNGEWFDVGERARREKTGQQIRDLLHTQYKSSTKAKAKSRKTLRGSSAAGMSDRLPPRSVSAPKSSTAASLAAARSASSSLPARVVTLDSKSRNSDAIARIGMQYRMRQNSEPDLSGLQSLQNWNNSSLGQQQQQGFPGQMGMSSFMQQQQQSTMAEQLQLQHQLNQQQNQMNQQQQQQAMMQQQGMMFDQHQLSQNGFGVSSSQHQPSSFLSMGSLVEQQQQQFDSNMSGLSMNNHNNAFLNAGTTAHAQPFASSNTRPQQHQDPPARGGMLFHQQQNDRMNSRFASAEEMEPIMPMYDNEGSTTANTTVYGDSGDVSYHADEHQQFDNVYQQQQHRRR